MYLRKEEENKKEQPRW